MMEIMSFGNQIRSGEYKIHSTFRSAINFISGDKFVFVVNERIGPGPVNIVINGIVPESIDSLKVEESCLKFNNVEYGFESGRSYNSAIGISEYNHEVFVRNLRIVEETVFEKAPAKSLAFLVSDIWGQFGNTTIPLTSFAKGEFEELPLSPNRDCEENIGAFELECRRKIRMGAAQILFGELISGVKMIKGLGPGLTPSGDDFNSGLLIAMNVVERIEEMTSEHGIPAFAGMKGESAGMTDEILRFAQNDKETTRGILESVYEAARGKNLFTNAFLECAANGNVFYKFRELIRALQFTNVKEIINNTELVMTMGETSGADQLTGFLIGMKRFLK